MEAWPSISETTFALTPSPSSSVAHVWRRSWKRRSSDAGAGPDALKGAVTQVGGVEQGAGLVREDEAIILPKPGQAHPLFELALAVILEGGGRSPGKAHAPPLA